jgi:hypothetical protein
MFGVYSIIMKAVELLVALVVGSSINHVVSEASVSCPYVWQDINKIIM